MYTCLEKKLYMRYKKLTQAFSIIEVMVVLAVLFIIIAMIAHSGSKARSQAMRNEAKAMIGALEISCDMFEADLGKYPTTDGGSGCSNLYNELVNDTGDTSWYGPYIELDDDAVSGGEILDPWENPYNYKKPGTENTTFFDLWSEGPDGSDGTSDDVINW